MNRLIRLSMVTLAASVTFAVSAFGAGPLRVNFESAAPAGGRAPHAHVSPSWFAHARDQGRHFAAHARQRIQSRDTVIAAGAVPHWTGKFSYQGTDYPFTMVGTDPARGSATTVVPTVLIPVRFVFSDGSVYDASTELIDGKTAAQGIIDSPIFQPYDFVVSGHSVGRTQYADAYQRANFFTDVSSRSPDYHVLLGQPAVLPVQTVNVPASQMFYYHDDATGIDVPIVLSLPTDATVRAIFENLAIPKGTLPIFVTGMVQWGSRGYHATLHDASGAIDRTFIYTSYNPYGLFGDNRDPDILILGHEVLEWLNDPFVTNITPGWNFPGLSMHTCMSGTFGDLLEVADPFGLVGSIHELAGGTQTYHVQDAAFLDWFSRQASSRSVNGAYSLFNDVSSPTTVCEGHLELIDTTTFTYPGSAWTQAFGINNRGDIVGEYGDAQGHYHGFSRIGRHMVSLDVPGATDTVALNINDQGLIVGYQFDDAGNIHGFSYSNGGYQSIDVPGSYGTYAEGVNADGDIVGGYYDASFATHGFVLRRGRFSTIDSPYGPLSELTATNDAGTTTGYSSDAFGTVLAGFTHDKRGFAPVAFPGALQTEPYGLNNGNDLSGIAYQPGICECTAGWVGFVAVNSPRGRQYRYIVGYAGGINDRGKIVGSAFGGRAFVATLPGRAASRP